MCIIDAVYGRARIRQVSYDWKYSQGVAAVILNRNAWPDTGRCVDSLLLSSRPVQLIVIVDNGSIDNSVERMVAQLPSRIGSGPIQKDITDSGTIFSSSDAPGRCRLVIVSVPFNTGVGGGRNIGLRRALLDQKIDYFFVIDNDAEIVPETIGACLETLNKAGADVVGCIVKSHDGSLQFSGQKFRENFFYFDILFGKSLYRNQLDYWDADFITGCASLTSRAVLERLKEYDGYLIDSSYFLYAEDQDFSLRIKRLGYRIVIARQAVVYHKISQGGAGTAAAHYYSSRNRLLLARRYFPPWLKLIFFVYYPLTRLLRSFFQAMRGSREIAWAHLEGLKDGFLGVKGQREKRF